MRVFSCTSPLALPDLEFLLTASRILPNRNPPAPEALDPAGAAEAAASAAQEGGGSEQLPFPDLTALLLDTPGVYLSKVVEPHRSSAFSQEYTDYLAAESGAARRAGNADLADRCGRVQNRPRGSELSPLGPAA